MFFGGAHDSGYIPALISLSTERHLEKLIILKGSVKLAHEVQLFATATATEIVSFPRLFPQRKLASGPGQHRGRRASTSSSRGDRSPFIRSRQALSRPPSRSALRASSRSSMVKRNAYTPPTLNSSTGIVTQADSEEQAGPHSKEEASNTGRQLDLTKVRLSAKTTCVRYLFACNLLRFITVDTEA